MSKKTYATACIETAVSAVFDEKPCEIQSANHQTAVVILPWNGLGTVFQAVLGDLFLQNSIESVEQRDPVVEVATGERPLSRKPGQEGQELGDGQGGGFRDKVADKRRLF